jgi:hypothetical protein
LPWRLEIVPNITGRPVRTAICFSRAKNRPWASPPEMSGPIWKMPVPSSAIAPTSRSSSDQSAIRLATGVSSGVTCVVARELENPRAPARIASCTAAAMRARSSPVAGSVSARSPMTYMRRAEWPR